jgi:protein-tyrosine phosphatase
MAEGMFIQLVQAAGLSDQIEIDSAGTGGWHVGERADRRMRETAENHGIELPSRARKVRLSDFETFDYLLAMDESNLSDLLHLQKQATHSQAKVFKMRHFDPEAPDTDVPDPYYGGGRGFEHVYEMLERACANFLAYLVKEHDLQPAAKG